MTTLYKIPAPYSMGDKTIEVYGEPDTGAYEWRVIEGGRVLQDTKNRGYGSPEIALRDALMVESGLEDPHLQAMRRIEEEGPRP